jgi:hypothetical protein
MANSRPYPLQFGEMPQVNPAASSQGELDAIWAAINRLIMAFNNLTLPVSDPNNPISKPVQDQQKKNPPGSSDLPYDGVSPGHDGKGWYITNGDLKAFPGAQMVLAPAVDGTAAIVIAAANGGAPVMMFDTTNQICYPTRIVVPRSS